MCKLVFCLGVCCRAGGERFTDHVSKGEVAIIPVAKQACLLVLEIIHVLKTASPGKVRFCGKIN